MMTDQLARDVAEGLGWEWKLSQRAWLRGPRDWIDEFHVNWSCAGIVLEEMRKRGWKYRVEFVGLYEGGHMAMFWQPTGELYSFDKNFYGFDPDLPTAIFKAAKEAL